MSQGHEVRWTDLRAGQQVRCHYPSSTIVGTIVQGAGDPFKPSDSLYLRSGRDLFPVYTLHKALRIVLEWTPKPEQPRGLGAVVELVGSPSRQWVRQSLADGACWIPTSGTLEASTWDDLPEELIVRAEGWLP